MLTIKNNLSARGGRKLYFSLFVIWVVGMASAKTAMLSEDVIESFLTHETAQRVLAEPDYYVWGLSAFCAEDGRVHAYYSRWPKETGMKGWLYYSEIAHAVADSPAGPFETTGVVLASRNEGGWDAINAHNPYVCYANGKVYLYYISNDLRQEYEATQTNPFPDEEWLLNHWDVVRDRQRIGLAVAKNPAGPFVREKEPVVVPQGPFKSIAVNPAVVYRAGRFMMIMKGDDVRKEGIFRIQFVGFSDRAEGPFRFDGASIYDKQQTEDACVWYDEHDQQFHTLFHVMNQPHLVHMVSSDGTCWEEARPFVFVNKYFDRQTGETWCPQRVERPFVLPDESGRASWLYLAVKEGETSGNIAIPLNDSGEIENRGNGK